MIRLLRLVLPALVGFAGLARAQGVVVAPHAVVIDHRTRSASITLYNPGAAATEVSIATFFGYPVTDSAGSFELATPSDPGSLPSAAGWIEAYPRRTVIGPLERQTIRLLARTPASLPDGEYWTRIMITAKGGQAPVILPDSAPAGIQVGLNLEVRTIIPLQYRKGTVTTGLAVGEPRAAVMGDSLVIRAVLTRQGNAAFIGTVKGTLAAPGGAPAASFAIPIAVYQTVDPRFALPIAGVKAGRYRLRLEVTSERTDLPAEQLVKAAPASSEVDVVLP